MRGVKIVMTNYHCPESCNKCGGLNSKDEIDWSPGGSACEIKTECQDCGFKDYWSYGFFESEIESKCETYSFDHKKTDS